MITAKETELVLLQKQNDLEASCYSRGIERFRKINQSRSIGSRTSSDIIFKDVLDNISIQIAVYQKNLKAAKTRNKPDWYSWFYILDPEKTAWLTIYEILGCRKNEAHLTVTLGLSTSVLSKRIGTSALYQSRYDHVLEQLKISSKKNPKDGYMRKHIINGMQPGLGKSYSTKDEALKKVTELYGNKPSQKVISQIGSVLWEIAVRHSKEWFIVNQKVLPYKKKTKTLKLIGLSPEAVEHIKKIEHHLELDRPLYLPMIAPPLDWHLASNEKLLGGYQIIVVPFISNQNGLLHTADTPKDISSLDIDVTNVLQRTKWKINKKVLSVMQYKFLHKHDDAGLYGDPELLEQSQYVSKEEFDCMDSLEKKQLVARIKQAVRYRQSVRSKILALNGCLRVAEEFQDVDPFYFVQRCDFRLRRYPVTLYLNPQGDDFSKSLLQFSDGIPLGQHGLKWLKLYLANVSGKKQKVLSISERIKWVENNTDIIHLAAQDPLVNNWWAQTDESPFCLLAACMEYSEAVLSKNPADYVSHLPVFVDATCSGIQHLSNISKDTVTAVMSNCSNSTKRQDIYTYVQHEVQKLMEEQSKLGVHGAVYWTTQRQVTRETVKRAVMTLGYGVTQWGVKDQLFAEGRTDDFDMAGYLGSVIWSRFGDGNLKALIQTMTFLKQLSRALAKGGYPLKWQTPSGSVITQAYWQTVANKVETFVKTFSIRNTTTETRAVKNLGFSTKQVSSAAPNFIHSYDAAHLALTVKELYNIGIRDFSMIHDSYGCHAGNMEIMNQVLREQFVTIYRDNNILEQLIQHVKSYCGDVVLPKIPETGIFDVTLVLNSLYFFS